MTIWDDPELKMNSDFVKFETPGDTIIGSILSIGKHTFPDGKKAPQILLDTDGGERTLTVGQFKLRELFDEQRPAVGDRIKVTYTEMERLTGGKTLKHFTLAVSKGAAPKPAPVDEPF